MERYNVLVITSSGDSTRLLVPFAPGRLVADFQTEIERRAVRQGTWLASDDLRVVLHLNNAVGPILDTEDVLADVVLSPRTETVAAVRLRSVPANTKAKKDFKLQLRVITPALAQRHRELSDIPVLSETVAAGTTLRQLTTRISNHLNPTNASATANWILDLYAAGIPVTTQNLEKTAAEAKLDNASVKGVLNIYTVRRRPPGRMSSASVGKDVIFGNNECWTHPNAQSERGMAMLLSSLRVFTERINASSMDQLTQDAILHAVHLLTNFPPAVRTTYILMSGRSPKPYECAALSQALYEVLRGEIISRISTGPNDHRVFELSRLLLGLVLVKAKDMVLHAVTPPYLDAMQTFDLQASSPIPIGKEVQVERLKALCGTASEVVSFEENPNPALKYSDSGRVRCVFSFKELSHLGGLAMFAERKGLAVVAPTKLAQTETPALTLDGKGLLAVYTGRTACSNPGEDFTIFRPTKNREESVDVALIIQRLAPIIQQREQDGTTIYDSFGVGDRRTVANPDEILMICVDTSRSMDEPSDLAGIINDPGTFSSGKPVKPEQTHQTTITLDEMKNLMVGHESWLDIIGMLNNSRPTRSRDLEDEDISVSELNQTGKAQNIIRMIRILSKRELHHNRERLSCERLSCERLSCERLSYEVCRTDAKKWQSKAASLEKSISGLDAHQQAISDFLVFRANNTIKGTDDWIWRQGKRIPGFRRGSPSDKDCEELSIPNEFLDPLSLELLDDPVKTTDGFVYGRKVIERWFQIRKTSPNTGLEVSETSLTPATDLANRINAWVLAEDILKPGTTTTFEVQIMTRTAAFNRRVTNSLTLKQLYQVVFRGMKGRHSNFCLSCRGTSFGPSRRTIASENIREGSVIHTYIDDTLDGSASKGIAGSSPGGNKNLNELCLIKVFDDPARPLFSYWVPQDTTKSLGSVMFKYWRYAMKNFIWCEIDDRHIYTSLQRLADGYLQTILKDHWLPLSKLMNNFDAYGTLEEEDLFLQNCSRKQHQPMILKVKIGGCIRDYSSEQNKLTRLDVLKQMFEAFTNRILAYNYQTHIGLITFDTVPKVAQAITHVFEDFRHTVNSMHASGNTAMWDALDLAHTQLIKHAREFPQAKKRVLCISDGVDTSSRNNAVVVCKLLKQHNITVDSFCIGSDHNLELRTVSYILGGYKFAPRSLEAAMAICELEPVLTQTERKKVERPQISGGLTSNAFAYLGRNAKAEVVTRDTVPARKEHINANDSFIRLSGFVRSRSANRTDSNLRNSRLHTEIKEIVARAHPYYDVYISESNMAFWKVVMQGPPGSSYAAGTFVLYLDMEKDYPVFPPKGRFMTPIYHPNINRHGRICHSIFDRNWTADTTNAQVLNTVYGLLMQPELTDPVNAVITLDFHHDEARFDEEVKEHIAKHATKNRQQWAAELTGDDGQMPQVRCLV